MQHGTPAQPAKPLLSICIPTYNGAHLLGNVLGALLPQVREFADRVEIIISDDGSPDGMDRVMEAHRHDTQIRYIRNPANIGMSPNIVGCVTNHAKGEYVWVWSQHCLIRPGALAIVIKNLTAQPELDAFYVNFRCATFPDDWPSSTSHGYDGAYRYVNRNDLDSDKLDRWEQLLTAETAVCTQTYAHILRRSLALTYWSRHQVGRDFGAARDTYSQTCCVAETMFGKPCGYLKEPVFTIFNGAQTWSSLKMRSLVYLQAHPELLRIYHSRGWNGREYDKARMLACHEAIKVVMEHRKSGKSGDWQKIGAFGLKQSAFLPVIRGSWEVFIKSEHSGAKTFRANAMRLNSVYRYLFLNCRPARWFRGKLSPLK